MQSGHVPGYGHARILGKGGILAARHRDIDELVALDAYGEAQAPAPEPTLGSLQTVAEREPSRSAGPGNVSA